MLRAQMRLSALRILELLACPQACASEPPGQQQDSKSGEAEQAPSNHPISKEQNAPLLAFLVSVLLKAAEAELAGK